MDAKPKKNTKTPKRNKFFKGKEAEVTAALKVAWESGCNNLQACAFAGISYESLKKYWTKYPEFKMERKRLKQMLGIQSKMSLYNGVQSDPTLAFKVLQVKERAEFGPQVGIIKADLSEETLSPEELTNLKKVLIQEDIDFDEQEFISALQDPNQDDYGDDED